MLKWSEKLTGDSHGHWRAGPSSSARLDHARAKGHAAVPEEKGLKFYNFADFFLFSSTVRLTKSQKKLMICQRKCTFPTFRVMW